MQTLSARVMASKAAPDLSLVDSVLHDAGTAAALIARQLAQPLTSGYGIAIVIGAVLLTLALAWPVRLWMMARIAALLGKDKHDHQLAIYAQAVGEILVTAVLVTLSAQIALAAIRFAIPLLPETLVIANSLAAGISIAGLGLGIGRALRAPDDTTRRPVPLPAGLGGAAGFYPFAAGIALGLTGFIDSTSRVLAATTTSWTIAQGFVVLVEATVIARFLVLAGKARERLAATQTSTEAPAIPKVFGMAVLGWAALALGCGALLTGHTRFAMTVLQELLWAALVLTTAWLLTRFVEALVARLLDTDRGAGRFATAIVGVRQARVVQAALLGSALLAVLIWLFAAGLALAPLHGDGRAVVEQVRPGPLIQSLQSLNIAPRSIGLAVIVLLIGVALTRLFRRWLETRFLPSTSLDVGARTSIVTGLSYLGIIIAMLSATNALGVQLEKLTLIASALTVGIGFGLQSIIQNFVSGLILLVERPVKLGDWVVVAGAEGNIRRIRVRATELATADGGIAIVPNSAFISSNVSNRADKLMSSRLDLSLTVKGCASAEDARDTILDLVGRCETLRDDPAPRLYLNSLGEEQWGFVLKVYGKQGHSIARARSDLLFALSEGTKDKAIAILLS